MNYEANTTLWPVGSLVLHDDDSKEPQMLMRVTSYSKKTGEFRTRYAHPAAPKQWKNKVWRNDIKSLHDPARFGIKVSNVEVTGGAAKHE